LEWLHTCGLCYARTRPCARSASEPHIRRAWTTVMIQEVYGDHCWVHCVEDGSEFELDINFHDYKFYPVNPRYAGVVACLILRSNCNMLLPEWTPTFPACVGSCVDDMTSLHFLHEPGILRNLEERSQPVNQVRCLVNTFSPLEWLTYACMYEFDVSRHVSMSNLTPFTSAATIHLCCECVGCCKPPEATS
jgi:hypothetical protein